MCGLAITLDGEQVSAIKGDPADPHSKGYLCPKALALQELHEDPDRLRQPLRRRGNDWEEIGWEEALDEAADRLDTVRRKHGKNAVATYAGNPAVHNTGTLLHLYDLYDALGTQNRFASHSLDQLPLMLVCGELFGHIAMFPVPDLDRTNFFLVFGANPFASNGSLMATPDVRKRFRALREKGGQIVVVDPRRTRTADAADQYIPIRPGTDAWMLLAMLNVILSEGLDKPGRLRAITPAYDALLPLLGSWSPERAEAHSGVPADTIRQLARDFAAAGSAIAYGRLGVSTQEHGTLCQWALVVLNLVSGNLDEPGGVLFAKPAVDLLRLLAHESKHGRWHSRVRGLPETGGDLPSAVMAEEMAEPGPGQIRGLLSVAGNPVLSAPNGKRLAELLPRLDAYIAIDIYCNETTRHANLILPPATGLEVQHYDIGLQLVGLRNRARYSKPIVPISQYARQDHTILRALQRRLAKPWQLAAWSHHLGPRARLDLALKTGPYGRWNGRFLRSDGLSLAALEKHPHGLDLGPLEPALPNRLFHADKQIHVLPDAIRSAVAELEQESPQVTPTGTWQLIGRRHLRSNNSWMHNLPGLHGGSNTCTLHMNPEDAAEQGLHDGDVVWISSSTGRISAPIETSDRVMRGVVSLPHGWGHQDPLTKQRIANQHAGVSANDLTHDGTTDRISGNAVFQGLFVQIKPSF